MIGTPSEDSAALRARWLAELATALDAAQGLVQQLGHHAEAIEVEPLHERIEFARREVLVMRLRRTAASARDFNPEWIERIPWKHSA